MKYGEFASLIRKTYAEKFPNSGCEITCGVHSGCVFIALYLAKDRSECENHIMMNDMMSIRFTLDIPAGFDRETDDLPENLALENTAKSYAIKPENPRYLYCDYRKLSYRMAKGNAEKIITAFSRFVDRLYTSLAEDCRAGNLLEHHAALAAEKLNLAAPA